MTLPYCESCLSEINTKFLQYNFNLTINAFNNTTTSCSSRLPVGRDRWTMLIGRRAVHQPITARQQPDSQSSAPRETNLAWKNGIGVLDYWLWLAVWVHVNKFVWTTATKLHSNNYKNYSVLWYTEYILSQCNIVSLSLSFLLQPALPQGAGCMYARYQHICVIISRGASRC